MVQSEVAEMRQRIEWECEALQRMRLGFAAVASHDTIQHKYRQLEQYQNQLGQLIGEEQATELMVETYNRVVR